MVPGRAAAPWEAGLLVLVVVGVYLGSLDGAFQFDDYNVIVFNPVVHSFEAWRADLGAGIRPLLKLSHTINWVLAPEAPFGFHVVNVGVHAVNTVLVGVLVGMFARDHGIERPAPAAAIVAALAFGLHPAHTEAVTYLSGRSASLMAMFYLGGMVAYVAGRTGARPWLATIVAPLLFVLAMAAKETAITFPFMLLLWEGSRAAPRDGRAIARALAPTWLALIAAVVVLALHPVYAPRLVPDLGVEALGRNLLTQIDAVGHLLGRLLLVLPANIDPDLRTVDAWSPPLAARAAILAMIAATGVYALRRRPWWGFGILAFFLQLAPTNSLLPRLDLANDRHLYLASVSLFIALGVELQRRPRWPLVVLLVAFGALTVQRNRDYASEIRLWEQTALVSPRKPRVFNNLGVAYSTAGCLEQAAAAYHEALRLDPGYRRARDNLDLLQARMTSSPSLRCDRDGPVRPGDRSGR